MSLSLCLTGCTVGSDIKGFEELSKQKFPHVNEAPNVDADQQKAMGEKLLKTYTQGKNAMESERAKALEEAPPSLQETTNDQP